MWVPASITKRYLCAAWHKHVLTPLHLSLPCHAHSHEDWHSAAATQHTLPQDGRWVEDADYSAFLDTDWDVGVMRDAAYRALNAVGDDVMHFRPPDEQNDHKITCGVMVRTYSRPAATRSRPYWPAAVCKQRTIGHVVHRIMPALFASSNTPGMQVGVLDQVEDRLRMAMRESGVKAQIITSGTGDWYVVESPCVA